MAEILEPIEALTKAGEAAADATRLAEAAAEAGGDATKAAAAAEAAAKATNALQASAVSVSEKLFSGTTDIFSKMSAAQLDAVRAGLEKLPTAAKEAMAAGADADQLTRIGKNAPGLLDDLIKTGKMSPEAVKGLIANVGENSEIVKGLSQESKLALALKYGFKFAVIGGVAGAGIYIAKKLDKQSDGQKACNSYCLPSNWDEIDIAGVGGTLTSKDIQYRTLTTITADNGGKLPKPIEGKLKFDSNFPLCNADISDCGAYCGKKCADDVPLDIPGASGVTNTIKNLLGDANDEIKKLLDGLGFGDIGKYLKYFGIAVGVIFLVWLIFFFINKT